jgi:arsenite methyltransferase
LNPAEELRAGVWQAYNEVGDRPDGQHPFAVGRQFAEGLGYPPALLNRLPDVSVEAFTGVSNVGVFAEIPSGATVLDLGCGAGTDTLIAAERAGPSGQVLGLDFSPTMLARARRAASEVSLVNVSFYQAAAEALPLTDRCIDIVMVNGIFNLNPARARIFDELGRVVKPGGTVYAAELILREPASITTPAAVEDWFS